MSRLTKLTSPMTFIQICFVQYFYKFTFSWLCIKKKQMCLYIKFLIPEFLTFCTWHNLFLYSSRAIMLVNHFKSALHPADLKSLTWLLPELYSSHSYYHYLLLLLLLLLWCSKSIFMHSVRKQHRAHSVACELGET